MKTLFTRVFAFLLSLFSLTGWTDAASSDTKVISSSFTPSAFTVSDIVLLALRDNPLLVSEEARATERRLSADQQRSWSGPSIEVSAGRRSDESNSGSLFEASAEQPVPLFGKRNLQGQLSDLEAEAWAAQWAASKSVITLEVIRLSAEVAINRRWAAFMEERQNRFALIRSYMEGRVFPSPQKKTERRIVQNKLQTLLSETLHAQADYKTAIEGLRAYAPLEPETFPDIHVPWLAGSSRLDAAGLMEKALKENTDLRQREIAVKSAEAELALAGKDKWPDPKLTASYENGKATERETNTSLGLALDFPAWNGNRSGIKSAENKRIAEQRLRDFEVRRIKSELPQTLIQYEAARKAVTEYPEALLEEVNAQLRDSEEGFRKGQVDLLTFLELDDSSAEMVRHILDSQLNFWIKATDLFRFIGEQDVLARLESL